MLDLNQRSGGSYEIFQNDAELNRYSASCQLLDRYMNIKFYWGFDTSIADMDNNIVLPTISCEKLKSQASSDFLVFTLLYS